MQLIKIYMFISSVPLCIALFVIRHADDTCNYTPTLIPHILSLSLYRSLAPACNYCHYVISMQNRSAVPLSFALSVFFVFFVLISQRF